MSNILGTLVYRITGDTASLEKNLTSSKQGIKELGVQIEKTGQKIRTFAKTTLTTVLVKSLLDSASRVEELESKFNTVFSGISAITDKWAKEYADATNRGITATKEFLATQQDLRTGYGDTAESAAEFSKAVVGITNDLASFSNIPIEQAMQSMQSGLNQQFEALRSLGVSLSVAILEQGEYAKSIGKTWEQMSNLEKQEAILSGVVSQSKNALHQVITDWKDYDYTLGDAALTSKSFANSSQGLVQTLDDLKAELGDALLPIATEVVNILTSMARGFNDLPGPIQSATTAMIAFATAVAMVSGPAGIAIGAVSALAIGLSNVKTSEDKLKKSTENLNSIMESHRSTSKKLAEDTGTLTSSQRLLLETQQKLAKAQANSTLAKMVGEYADLNNKIKENSDSVASSQARYDALSIAMEGGQDACKEKLKELEHATDQYSNTLKNQLNQYAYMSKSAFKKDVGDVEKASEELQRRYVALTEDQKREAKAIAALQESLVALALAYNDGLIDLEVFKAGNEDLYNAIKDTAKALEEEQEKIDKQAESIASASYASTEWAQALREQQAAIAESNKDYEEAFKIRKELLAKEQDSAIRQLASDAGLIKSGENLAEISTELLVERINANENAKKELQALNEYYANEEIELEKTKNDAILEIQQEAQDKLKANQNEVRNLLNTQIAESNEMIASEYEAANDFESAYNIRIRALHKERDEAIAAMEEKVKISEATQAEIDGLSAYYINKEIELNKDKNDKIRQMEEELASERKKNAEETASLIEDQRRAYEEEQASELERIGLFKQATSIRIGLLQDERDEAIAAMEEKVRNGEATEQELLRIKQYYANEESNLIEEQSNKIRDSIQEAMQSSISSISSFVSAVKDLYSSATEARISAIDKETDEQLKALGLQEKTEMEKLQEEYNEAIKNGDMELAQEKARDIERQRIEDEAAERKAKIQLEEAKREKKIAIFQATIDTLSAVIGFLSNPGSYAGIALSAMAAATGAMQIAAIQAEPLPSYAVGAVDVSEDHIAQIHQGEMIIPKMFAEGVRDGDISIGGQSSDINITIINNTGAEVSTEKSDDGSIQHLKITIGSLIDSQIRDGRYDSSLIQRYSITRRNTRA